MAAAAGSVLMPPSAGVRDVLHGRRHIPVALTGGRGGVRADEVADDSQQRSELEPGAQGHGPDERVAGVVIEHAQHGQVLHRIQRDRGEAGSN